jgi:hypothetical protein
MALEVLKSKVVMTDDTPVPMQMKDRSQTKRCYMWVYLGDDAHPYTIYDFTTGHSRDGPNGFFEGYGGRYIQADAAPVYDELFADGKILEVGCWAHARRYFHESQRSDRERAQHMLKRIQALYRVEREAKELSAEDRAALRREKSRPVLDEIKAWLEDQDVRVLPKSPIGGAIAYATRHWTALTRYLDDGDLRIDNNLSENALRGVVVGRKNWLFVGSEEGGHAAAVFYSIIRSCERNGVEPFAYLRDVLARLPSTPISQLPELLPDRWEPKANLPQPPR